MGRRQNINSNKISKTKKTSAKNKKEITDAEKDLMINELIKGQEDFFYFIFDNKLVDYFKVNYGISSPPSGQSIFIYNIDDQNNHFIELTVVSNNVTGVLKVPIIKTNVTCNFTSIIQHDFSIDDDYDFILISFETGETDKHKITIKTIHKSKETNSIVSEDNNNFFLTECIKDKEIVDNDSDDESLCYPDEENENAIDDFFLEDTNITESKNSEIHNFFDLIHEEVKSVNLSDVNHVNLDENTIKNVIYHTNINFDNFKSFFRKLPTLINVSIIDNKITFSVCLSSCENKIVKRTFPIIPNNQNVQKNVNFIIDGNSILKLKSIDRKYNIVSSKKIFKNIDLKIVVSKSSLDEEVYGLTISPGNLEKEDYIKIIEGKNFDIYSSILIYIPQKVSTNSSMF